MSHPPGRRLSYSARRIGPLEMVVKRAAAQVRIGGGFRPVKKTAEDVLRWPDCPPSYQRSADSKTQHGWKGMSSVRATLTSIVFRRTPRRHLVNAEACRSHPRTIRRGLVKSRIP